MHFLLFYEKAPDFAARQAPLQDAHREHLDAAVASGELLLAGNLGDPSDGSAMLLFEAESPASAGAFAAADPYVLNGIVTRWTIRSWDTVLGAGVPRL